MPYITGPFIAGQVKLCKSKRHNVCLPNGLYFESCTGKTQCAECHRIDRRAASRRKRHDLTPAVRFSVPSVPPLAGPVPDRQPAIVDEFVGFDTSAEPLPAPHSDVPLDDPAIPGLQSTILKHTLYGLDNEHDETPVSPEASPAVDPEAPTDAGDSPPAVYTADDRLRDIAYCFRADRDRGYNIDPMTRAGLKNPYGRDIDDLDT